MYGRKLKIYNDIIINLSNILKKIIYQIYTLKEYTLNIIIVPIRVGVIEFQIQIQMMMNHRPHTRGGN
ncbi:MAG: hypothetical protein ACTSPY_08735 [Candidatus Helarchaeota archaeon]